MAPTSEDRAGTGSGSARHEAYGALTVGGRSGGAAKRRCLRDVSRNRISTVKCANYNTLENPFLSFPRVICHNWGAIIRVFFR